MLVPHSLRSLRYFFLFALLLLLFGVFTLSQTISATQFFLGGTTTRVSVASDGTEGNLWSRNSAISGNGRYIVFPSAAENFDLNDQNGEADIYFHDRQSAQTTLVSVATDGTIGNSGSIYALISTDGRYIAFNSFASNLVTNDTNNNYDIFVRDIVLGTTERVSIANDGSQGNSESAGDLDLSANGRFIVFESRSTNLVANDTNNREDIFVRDRIAQTTTRVSISTDGNQSDEDSYNPSISADGRYVVFVGSGAKDSDRAEWKHEMSKV